MPTIWRLDGTLGRYGRLGESRTISSMCFVDDSTALRVKDEQGDAVDVQTGKIVDFDNSDRCGWGGPSGRCIASTAKGDLWVFVQPRIPREATEEEESIMIEDETFSLRGLPMWWESPAVTPFPEGIILPIKRI